MPGFDVFEATTVFRGAREPNRLGPCAAIRHSDSNVIRCQKRQHTNGCANAGVAVVQSKAQAAVSKRLSTVRRTRRFLGQYLVVEAVAKTGLLRSLVIALSSVVAAEGPECARVLRDG